MVCISRAPPHQIDLGIGRNRPEVFPPVVLQHRPTRPCNNAQQSLGQNASGRARRGGRVSLSWKGRACLSRKERAGVPLSLSALTCTQITPETVPYPASWIPRVTPAATLYGSAPAWVMARPTKEATC